MSSFDDRYHFPHVADARLVDVPDAIAWCRDNIPVRHRDIICSARLWSITPSQTITSHSWCSIRPHDTDELLEYLTPSSMAMYSRDKCRATFAFYNRDDSLLFDLRWRA